MEKLDLKRLKAYGDAFVRKIIFNSKSSSSVFTSDLINLSKDGRVNIDIKEYEYYLPENIRFIDTDINRDNTKSFALSVYGSILSEYEFEVPYIDKTDWSKKFNSKSNKSFGFIIHIEVFYQPLNEDEIDIILVDLISNFYPTNSSCLSEWKTIKERINQSNMVASVSPFSNLLEKIDSIELAEDLMNSIGSEIEEDLFIEKVISLQKVANHPNPNKVYSEYGSVSQLTEQPVLMNKSLSIFLTKDEVLGLVKDLSKKYEKIISNVRTANIHNLFKANKYVVPVEFGKTERGHADFMNFKIVLPKLGDWRTGYRDVYTAELVFHEFSHILDSGRKMTTKNGDFDVHRHDFVKILDMVLLEYKDFINQRYSVQMLRDMILNIKNWTTEFRMTYKERIKSIKIQENNRRVTLEQSKKDDLSAIGITNDSFPLEVILKEYRTEKLNFLLFSLDGVLNKNVPDYIKSTILKARIKLLDALDGIEGSLVFDKKEINEINNSVSESNIGSWISEQPYESQINLLNPIKEFKDKVRDLAENKLNISEKPKESLDIEDYDIDAEDDFLSFLNS